MEVFLSFCHSEFFQWPVIGVLFCFFLFINYFEPIYVYFWRVCGEIYEEVLSRGVWSGATVLLYICCSIANVLIGSLWQPENNVKDCLWSQRQLEQLCEKQRQEEMLPRWDRTPTT